MATKIPVIDTDACIACGNCEAVCPEVFHLNKNLGHSRWSIPSVLRRTASRMPSTSARLNAFPGRLARPEADSPFPFRQTMIMF